MTTVSQNALPGFSDRVRLHLYLASGCPFCHRVFAALKLTGQSHVVSITWMKNVKGAAGWEIEEGEEPLFGESKLSSVYQKLESSLAHRPSVPLMVDLASKTLLSTSSSQMLRFFSEGMNGTHVPNHDLCPRDRVDEIDSMNAWLHTNINRAVYDVGFAATQLDYQGKVLRLFDSLDELESRLSVSCFLMGDSITESDLYLFATLIRFDSVYHPLFRCSVRRIQDYVALPSFLSRLRSIDELEHSYDYASIKEHYFCSVMHVRGEIRDLNPSRIIPVDASFDGS